MAQLKIIMKVVRLEGLRNSVRTDGERTVKKVLQSKPVRRTKK